MGILKYKYKAHKFINYAFYVVVFLVGFLLGFGAKNINFSKLLSQVLMIDSVSAYDQTIPVNSSYRITSSNYYNEEFLYNFFNYYANEAANLNLSFIDYPYVYSLYGSSTDSIFFYCSSPTPITRSSEYYFTDPSDCHVFQSSSSRVRIYTLGRSGYSISSYYLAATENYSSQYGSRFKKLLDFSEYTANLEFNENLFKDNPDFKEVCVPNNRDFAISSNNYELNENESSEYYGTKSYSSYEFIWFPYYPKGLVSYLYDNSKTDNVWIPEEDDTYFNPHPIFHYWLDEKEIINEVWSSDDPGNTLNSLGYTDKYSYFGWYTHPFVVRYANSGLRQFSVFRFNEDFEFYSTLENGLDYFEKLEEARNGNICFYIRKDFDVNLLNTDEFGDKYGDITIMEDEKLEISTSVNISSLDSKGLFEKVKLFLNEMTDSIDFVKDYIFDLYDSMPYLLKLFIVSVFGLIVIKILIGMVVR